MAKTVVQSQTCLDYYLREASADEAKATESDKIGDVNEWQEVCKKVFPGFAFMLAELMTVS